MKTKRYHNTRGWGRALSALLALALAVGLVLTVPPLDGLALADEGTSQTDDGNEGAALALDTPCSLTLNLPSQFGLGADNTEAGAMEREALVSAAVIDYYKIAEAVPVAGYDVYEFCVDDTSPYFSVIEPYVNGNTNFVKRTVTAQPKGYKEVQGATTWLLFRYEPADRFSAPVSDWADLVEVVTRTCFDGLAVKEPQYAKYGKVENKPGTIGAATTDLAPGLYLTVVHGSDVAAPTGIVYRKGRKAFTSTYPWYLTQQEKDNGRLYRSIVYTNNEIYTFQPQLIALPGTTTDNLFYSETPGTPGGQATPENPNGYADTTTGDWDYTVDAVLKYISRPHMASLRISKTIEVAEGTIIDPASFVFRVAGTGVKFNEETGMLEDDPGYQDLRTLRFDATTGAFQETEIAFDGIKAGSDVTVTEELSDASYKLTLIKEDYTKQEDKSGNRSIVIENLPGGNIVLTVPDPANEGQSVEVVLQGEAIGTTVTISATNTHTNTTSTSGSVVNEFDPNDTGWTWTKWHYTGVQDENGNIVNETWKEETGKTGTFGQNSEE